jgi:hypothetical protein
MDYGSTKPKIVIQNPDGSQEVTDPFEGALRRLKELNAIKFQESLGKENPVT